MGKIMNLKSAFVTLVLMLALISVNFTTVQVGSQVITPPIVPYPSGPFDKFGPRIDRLMFKAAGSLDAEARMLKEGEIDIMDWSVPGAEWENWLADPEITMGDYAEYSFIYVAMNLFRWPLGHGDMIDETWSWNEYKAWDGYSAGKDSYLGDHDPALWDSESETIPGGTGDKQWIDDGCTRCQDAKWFRRGLSHLADRSAIVANMRGAGVEMETLIFPQLVEAWEDPTAARYEYSYDLAMEAFANGSFIDYDEDGWLEYSPSHASDPAGPTGPADMEELPSLQMYIRADDPYRIFGGTSLHQNFDLAGVPNNLIITSNTICSLKVWQEYDYDIYIEYWDWVVPIPDHYYEAFHSEKDTYPTTFMDNQHRYHSQAFDAAADNFKEAAVMGDAIVYCKEMQRILHGDAAVIPLYDVVGFSACRTRYGDWPGEGAYKNKNWTDMCNEPGVGWFSYWSPLNVRVQGFQRGGTLRHGLLNDITTFNILDTYWTYDALVLEEIYELLIVGDPENMSNYIPWLCESYEVGEWWDGTAWCSAVNLTLIPGIVWQDYEPFTAADVDFSIRVINFTQAPGYYIGVKDIHSTVTYWDPVEEKETIEIRFKLKSWLALSWVNTFRIVPEHIWGKIPDLWTDPTAARRFRPDQTDEVIGTGPFMFNKDGVVGRPFHVPMQYILMERNPTYFRRLVRPEFCSSGPSPTRDGKVDLQEFMVGVGQFGLTPMNWHPTYGPRADVDKDNMVMISDLTEIAVRYGDTGYINGYPYYYM